MSSHRGVLVLLAGLGFIVSRLFDTDPTGTTDPTTVGALHDLGGNVSMLGLLVSVWMLRGVFAPDDGYRHVVRFQKWFPIRFSAAFLAALAFEGVVGLTQRALVVVVISWLLFLATNLRRVKRPLVAV